MSTGKKYYKIVYGFDENLNYLPINSDELHKAFVLAIEGGKGVFEEGFLNNRGNDILRIVPDWHRAKGWNKGYEMNSDDFVDIRPLEESYKKTLANGKLLAEYIVKENRRKLLSKPASDAFKEIKKLATPEHHQLSEEMKKLADGFQG